MKCATIVVMIVIAAIPLFSCSGKLPKLGVTDGALAHCPSSPNCISSDSVDSEHQVAPLQLAVPPAEAWPVVRELVSKLPHARIITASENYIHAECQSSLFGFVDDLELYLRAPEGLIAVRSAARLGYSDFGVNRSRIEALRISLIGRKVVK